MIKKCLDSKDYNGNCPCFNDGFKDSKIDNIQYKKEIIGNSKEHPNGCTKIVKELLKKDTPCFFNADLADQRAHKSENGEGHGCSINGVYEPRVPTNIQFYGVSGIAFMKHMEGRNTKIRHTK